MHNSAEFRASLFKPMLLFIALIVLNGAVIIAIRVDQFIHMQTSWRSIIYSNIWIWNTLINSALIGGWFIYIDMRRRKAYQQK